MIFTAFRARVAAPLVIAAAALLAGGCREVPKSSSPARAKAAVEVDLNYLHREAIGGPMEGRPWITHVHPADLDGDGRMDVLACDARNNTIVWARQTEPRKFSEQTIADKIPGPVHVEAVDFDGDRDLDLLVASMGQVFPNNNKIGAIVVLENDGRQQFTRRVIAKDISRVTDVRAADFNRDGRLDLAVAQFGYDQGEVRWLENLGKWEFKSHNLLNLSGSINVLIADMNGDATPDIVTLVSQQWEEIYLFANDGAGNFTNKVIFGSTNEDFGSSGITLSDLNRDGRPDILYTNGDGFDYAEPGGRPWHGVQWLENRGGGVFGFHRIGNLQGAYSPVGVDLDRDGDMDVVAVSGFNDWRNPQAASLVMFRNEGQMNFTPRVLAHAPTHLLTCATADLDGDGEPVLITGGMHAYPPWEQMSRISLWRRTAP